MKLNRFFARNPVFTVAELDQFLAEEGTGNRWTRKALLAHHRRQGHVAPVRRGLYAVVPPGSTPRTSPVDPYLLASKAATGAILAYHTAMEFHGKAHSVFRQFYYLATRKSAPFSLRAFQFRSLLHPKALRDKHKEEFEVTKGERAGVDVRVTSLERTLVDLLDRPDLGGGWEEIWRSLESVEFYDLDRVVEYVKLLSNSTTTAKVGFFLDQHRDELMVEDRHLDPLRALRPANPHYLDRRKRESGHVVADWGLVVPKEILDRSWAEVT